MKYRKLLYTLFIVIAYACSNSGNRDANKGGGLENIEIISGTLNETGIALPTIDLLIDFNQMGIQYSSENVNNFNNIDRYIGQRAKELNLGIYMADFIYLASLNHQLNLSDYLGNIKYLLDELHIIGILDEISIKQFRNSLGNADSLYTLSVLTQQKILNFLESNNQIDVYLNITIGGFVESFYLFLAPIDNEEDFKLVEAELENYRFVFEEYKIAVDEMATSGFFNESMKDLSGLFQEFSKLDIKSTEKKSEITHSGSVHLSGGEYLTIDYGEFVNIREELFVVRNKFISLN